MQSRSRGSRRVQRIDHADAFFAATKADIDYRGRRAYYAHETSPYQFNRGLGGGNVWGDEAYAREELAELGAAFLCVDLEITPEVQADRDSYIATCSKFSRMTTA